MYAALVGPVASPRFLSCVASSLRRDPFGDEVMTRVGAGSRCLCHGGNRRLSDGRMGGAEGSDRGRLLWLL
jgi:hypothetical protein